VRSRTVARWTGCLAVVALTAGASGCGGSYSSAPMTTPPSTTGGGTADVIITINGQAGSMSYSPNPASVKLGHSASNRPA